MPFRSFDSSMAVRLTEDSPHLYGCREVMGISL